MEDSLACSVEPCLQTQEENGMLMLGWVLNVDSWTLFIPVLCSLSPKKTLPELTFELCLAVTGSCIILATVISTYIAELFSDSLIWS